MDRKMNRLVIFIATCSAIGVVLGGTASLAESNQCMAATTPTSECLTQDPMMKTVEGMSFGLLAGAGAAVGATWQLWQKNSNLKS